MIDLTLLPDGGMHWLDASGPKGHIVLSTRIRLARNIHGFAFGQTATPGRAWGRRWCCRGPPASW